MSYKTLFLIVALSVTMLTGCGGGGGSDNPVGYIEPAADKAFLDNPQYPGIVAAHSAMTAALVDPNDVVYDPADNTAAVARSATFLTYIDNAFKTHDGKDGKALLKTYMESRLHRYVVHKFTFIPVSHKSIDADTVEVTTHIFIHLVKKTWAGGVVPGAADKLEGPYDGGNPVVVWKKAADGVWKIQSGLPKEMYSTPS